MNTRQIGSEGEKIALNYLLNQGYKLVQKNYYVRGVGEIDIICEQGNTLIFVEVKYSKTIGYGTPLAKVDARKQQKIYATAEHFISQEKTHENYRFDVISIIHSYGSFQVNHIKDAFWGG